MIQIPETGFLRVSQIVPSIIPVSKSSWWAGVKAGKYPQPLKLGPRTTVWRAEDIRSLITTVGAEA
ncbi:transcriptional regulator [Methylomonas lenta]|uniref:Transcriptional regulator n=1 Tax=Methylomonas lenta TaxID=980561 RepID=A0A177NHM1_9GAMM|nr:AlpA family phage regulatory protein [Methylomonas lenta]OAI16560.1 transcriptional regulator [Methylomonas lenta]